MRVLIVGSGGREHALAWKISKSPKLTELYCAPGNPGTSTLAKNVPIAATEIGTLAVWAAQQKIDLVVVGPEAPLAAGLVDVFSEHGLRCFGPTRAAAQLESSKSFAKEIMQRARVNTPQGMVFTEYEDARRYLQDHGAPIVVKADGLASGKGVVVAQSEDEALAALDACMKEQVHGDSGTRVLLEDYIAGREASVMAVIDGETVLPFVVSQDYKRLNEEDQGPNTGGMGAISPSPVLSDRAVGQCTEKIFLPVIRELKNRGIGYRGFLYAGVILDGSGEPSVLEFNCRLGDPETQVLMLRMQNDLLEVLDAAVNGSLHTKEIVWRSDAAACVVASSRGYPGPVDDGKLIQGLFEGDDRLQVFQAGTAFAPDGVVSKGGRVLAVSALGETTEQALARVYTEIKRISFDGMYYRGDIGYQR